MLISIIFCSIAFFWVVIYLFKKFSPIMDTPYKIEILDKPKKRDFLPSYIQERLSSNLGETEAKCPYCGINLDSFPKAKKKCKNCKNFIYKRTRPLDNKPILIREEQIEAVSKEWDRKRFMLSYAFDEFESYEKELKEKRNTHKVPFNDVVWYKFEKQYWDAFNKGNLLEIENIYWRRASFLLDEEKYKSSFQNYLVFLFWQICGVQANIEGNKTTYQFFSDAKDYYDKWGGYETYIQFYGNIGRCLEHLNLSKKELENMVLNMPLEKGLNFPFTPEELLPYYLKAYDKHKREKKKFEKEYGIRYMIGGKIN